MGIEADQRGVCERHGVPWVASPPHLLAGVAKPPVSPKWPVNGLRHPPIASTTGWYLWAGDYSNADDFFAPLHVSHIDEWLPAALPYLGLPPGWRFLVAPRYEDVWFDPTLLEVS